jgi:pimeloyl-ACP methyl ester carboxylesterase
MTPSFEMIGKAHETVADGVAIAWGEMGAGPPLVLLHGLQDSHRAWRRAAPLLAEHFHLYMPDLPGHGLSGRPDAPYTLAWFSRVIAAWMEAVGVPRAHVCAHSFGGGVAQWMILEQRPRIDRLALVAPGGLGRGVSAALRFVTFPVFGPLLTPLAVRHIIPIVLRYDSATFGHMEPEEIERAVQMLRIPGTDRAFQRSVGGVINFLGQHMQTAQRAAEVAELPPIAMFWGTKDPIIPVRHGRKAAERAEAMTLTTYKGCGHYPHLDAPVRFARDLIAFLSDPDRPPARLRPEPEGKTWLGRVMRRP